MNDPHHNTPFGQNQRQITVVVADDHPIVRSGIINELSRHDDILVVGEATNGNHALRIVQERAPDMLVLDLSMPGLSTHELLQQILTLPKRPHVLILTAYDDSEHVMSLLQMGIKGYVMKDEDPEAITTAIRAVYLGGIWLSAKVANTMLSHSTTTKSAPSNDSMDMSDLSSRELEVLKLLAQGKDNIEISEALQISERTVRFHLRNIYDKLGVQRRGEAIALAVKRGL